MTRFYQPHRLKFLTGQQVTASVPGFGLAVSNHQWIPTPLGAGLVYFKGFSISLTQGGRTIHGPSDISQPAFSFYTVGNGVMDVKCDLTLTLPEDSRFAGGLPSFQAKAWLSDSVWPSVESGELPEGPVALYPGFFACGSTGQEGQEWKDVVIAVPSPFGQAGQGCFLQLISADRHLYRHTTEGYFSHFKYKRTDALDVGFPYPFDGAWYLPSTGRFYDSPKQLLYRLQDDGGGTDWYLGTASDSFRTYLMYRPPIVGNQSTVWVPLSRISWGWRGTAEKSSGNWQLTLHGKDPPIQERLTSHPSWNQYCEFGFTLIGE